MLVFTDIFGNSHFLNFESNPNGTAAVDGYEYSLETFSEVTSHFLAGGVHGWPNGKTPDAINKALTTLFEKYDQVDGRWVRKPITG